MGIIVLAKDRNVQSVKTDLHILKAELEIIKWMVGGIGFGMVLLLIKSFLG